MGPNGSSTIDLVFGNMGHSSLRHQRVLSNVVVRKHLPVETVFYLEEKTRTSRTREESDRPISRKMNTEKLGQVATEAPDIITTILTGDLDGAIHMIEQAIHVLIETRHASQRKAKPWFDATCYQARKATIQALHKTKGTPLINDIQNYTNKLRDYKQLLMEKKKDFLEAEESMMIKAAEENPFSTLQPRKPRFPRNIPMQTWEMHFSSVLRTKETRPVFISEPCDVDKSELFTTEEILTTIKELKDGKACGPDSIYNEHLKDSAEVLKDIWTTP